MLEMEDLESFVQFASAHGIRSIYCIKDKEQQTHFALSHKGGLIQVACNGYKTLSDYCHAKERGFEQAEAYYEANDLGFEEREAYLMSKQTELHDGETYKLMKEEGYLEGLEDYKRLLKERDDLPELAGVENAYDLFTYGQNGGFETWFEFQAALERGFVDANEYRHACKVGYENKQDHDAGIAGGFVNASEWKLAKDAECTTRTQYRKFRDLKVQDDTGLEHDLRVVLNLLSKLPENKKVPLATLEKLKEKELSIYQDEESKMFPSWFTFGARSKGELEGFLRSNELIKRYGTYQPEGMEFETHGIQEREVVLDGSNVAHNSHVDHKAMPTVENMILMVRYLRDKGFKNIKVISDASLKHKLDDVERLDELKEMVDYQESEPKTSADIFIIQYVKKNHCLLVSNDKFKEWKALDPWIGDNVDYYRLSFWIRDGKVSLTEFEA